MPVVVNKDREARADSALVAAISSYMAGREKATFDDIRKDVAGFATLKDGAIDWIARTAGFEIS